MTYQLQHYELQRCNRRPLGLPPPMQGHYVHLLCLPSSYIPYHPRRPRCTVGCQHPQSSGA